MSAKVISNRVNMHAALLDRPQFADITRSSIIGFGDEEMLRDRHGLLPLSYGGRVDWYIRTQKTLQRKRLVKTATLIEKTTDGKGVWEVTLNSTEAAGLYKLEKIRPAASSQIFTGEFTVQSIVRNFSLAGFDVPADITTAMEASYSPFQTVRAQFKDNLTVTGSMELGQTQSYDLELVGLPLLSEIQRYVQSRDVRSVCADVLVKAPVPCFVKINCTVNKPTTEAEPAIESIVNDIVASVHDIEFTGRLDASRIHAVIHRHLPRSMTVTDMDLYGEIWHPNDVIFRIRNPESIQIPHQPQLMTTARTVQFFTDAASVQVNIRSDAAA
jgi:hypothetical protein